MDCSSLPEMYPMQFSYERPDSLQDAIDLLAKYKGDVRPLAGGMSLIPLLKLRVLSVGHLIDINRIPDLKGVADKENVLEIGSMTSNNEILRDAKLRQECPILYEVAKEIGDVQVRNRGTIGGGIVEADPAGDWPSAMLAMGAEFEVAGPKGVRTVKAVDFFLDPYSTALEEDELLVKIKVKKLSSSNGVSHTKLERRTGDFAIGIVDAVVELDSSGYCKSLDVAVGAIATKPFRVDKANELAAGKDLNDQVMGEIKKALNAQLDGLDILSDIKAPDDYRKDIAPSLLERAVKEAYQRAKENKSGKN